MRDSLEQAPPEKSEKILQNFENQAPTTATVETEEGEILEVIFDPVLNSYFDPKTNTYYDLRGEESGTDTQAKHPTVQWNNY